MNLVPTASAFRRPYPCISARPVSQRAEAAALHWESHERSRHLVPMSVIRDAVSSTSVSEVGVVPCPRDMSMGPASRRRHHAGSFLFNVLLFVREDSLPSSPPMPYATDPFTVMLVRLCMSYRPARLYTLYLCFRLEVWEQGFSPALRCRTFSTSTLCDGASHGQAC